MKISRKLTTLLVLPLLLISCRKTTQSYKSAKRFKDIKSNTLLASAESTNFDSAIPNWKEVAKEHDLPLEMNSYELNNQGYYLYEKGLYSKAASLFEKAIDQDPLHPFASYNLACMLSLMMESGTNIDTNRIKDLLIFELTQDPSKFEKIKKDKDLTFYRNTDQYKKDYKEFIEVVLDGRWIFYEQRDYPGFITFSSNNNSYGLHEIFWEYDEETGDNWFDVYHLEESKPNEWKISDNYKTVSKIGYLNDLEIKSVGYNYIEYKQGYGKGKYYKSTTNLHEAVKKGDLNTVKKLIDRKVNINAIIFDLKILNNEKDSNILQPEDFDYIHYRTPLYYAIKNRDIKMVEYLIKKGAILNPPLEKPYSEYISPYNNEQTHIHPPFYAAIENDDIETASTLLSRFNLDLDKDKETTTYLLQAALVGSPQMIDYLIGQGMDVNKKYYGNESILDYLKFSKNVEIINHLKSHGAK